MNYAEALSATAARAEHFDPGSDALHAAGQRFGAFFASFTPDAMRTKIPETYADDCWFDDTLKTVRGSEALAHYLVESAEACNRCTVQVEDISGGGPDVYVRWRMMIDFKKFKSGTENWTIGMTHLRFGADGRILLHQDYWDSAEGLFIHVPVVGWAIRKIRARL
ncbi:MAG: nuclear transport factor 2 family protein [Phycisphaerales bacterium]